MEKIYHLQEFSPSKIASGEINPETLTNIKYQPYPTSSMGMVILDENTDLSNYRRLFSVTTSKTTWSAFTQTIDTKFSEFQTSSPPYKLFPKDFITGPNNIVRSVNPTNFRNPTGTNILLNAVSPGA